MHSLLNGHEARLTPQQDPVLGRFFWLASFIFSAVGAYHLSNHLQTVPRPTWRIAISVILILVALATQLLLWRGRQVYAFKLMIWSGWFVATAVAMVSGGIYSSNMMIYPLLIFAGGWLLSVRTGIVIAVCSLMATIGLALAQYYGQLPTPQAAPISVAAVTAVAMIVAAALCTHYFSLSYWRRYTQVHRLSVELQQSKYQLAYVLTVAGESVWNWDLRNNLVEHDQNWVDALGLDHAYLRHGEAEFTALVHEEDREHMLERLRKCLNGSGPYHSEHRMRRADGRIIWVRDRADVAERDAQGQAQRVIGSVTDITRRKQNEEQIHQLAFYDPLTKLPNRRLLHDRLGQAMAAGQRSGHYGAVLMMDLDNFKTLNDCHGHHAGDLLLQQVSQRLRACVRQSDTVARFGGDEFVVILTALGTVPNTAGALARLVGEKVRATLSAPYLITRTDSPDTHGVIEHHSSASVGITLFQGQQASADEVLRMADSAMYAAKEGGRNQVRLHTPSEAAPSHS